MGDFTQKIGAIMLKNIQTKIVMVFVIFGILVTTAIGTLNIFNIRKLESTSSLQNEITSEQIAVEAKKIEKNILYSSIFFLSSSLVLGIVVSKILINPFSKLLTSAEKIVKGEEIENNIEENQVAGKSEIDELIRSEERRVGKEC